jgi:hypothetical protein
LPPGRCLLLSQTHKQLYTCTLPPEKSYIRPIFSGSATPFLGTLEASSLLQTKPRILSAKMQRSNNNMNQKSTIRPSVGTAKQLIPPSRMPTQDHLISVLAALTNNIAGRSPVPEAPPLLPPLLPREYFNTEFADMYTVGLINEDLDPTKPIRQQSIQRVLLAIQIKHYRAISLPPPMQYRILALTFKLDKRVPSLPKGRLITAMPALEPIKVIISHPDNRSLITDNAANSGVPIIPELSHANICNCQALLANNNYESLQSIRMCMPKMLYKQYKENVRYPKCNAMAFAAPQYKNLSDVYVSEISHAGTVLPRMIRRSPVAQMIRSYPVAKKPQFSGISIQRSKALAAAVVAQLERSDIRQFTKYLNDPPTSYVDNHITRFQDINDIIGKNIDISSYGEDIASMEDILINEPLVDAFYGLQKCEFCDVDIFASDEITFLSHLLQSHMMLLATNFTCPACLYPTVLDANEYLKHYAAIHAKTSSLMFVLNETNVHVRMQHAHILAMFIFQAQTLRIEAIETEPSSYISPIGGFSKCEPEELKRQITELQYSLLPNDMKFTEEDRVTATAAPRYDDRSPSPPWTTVQNRRWDRESPRDQDAYSQHLLKLSVPTENLFTKPRSAKTVQMIDDQYTMANTRRPDSNTYFSRAHGSEYKMPIAARYREESSTERDSPPPLRQVPPVYNDFPQLQRSKTESSIIRN